MPTFQKPSDHNPAGQSLWTGNQNNETAHVYPKKKECLKEYYPKFGGRVVLTEIASVANTRIADFPFLPRFMNGNRNKLCYVHLLGHCPHNQCGRFNFDHAQQREVLDDFATALCQKIKPGVEYMVWNAPTAPGHGVGQGGSHGDGTRNVRQRF